MSRPRARSRSLGRRRTFGLGLPKFAEEPESPFSALLALSKVVNENYGTPIRVPATTLQLTGTPFPTITPPEGTTPKNSTSALLDPQSTSTTSIDSPPEYHLPPSPDLNTSPPPEPTLHSDDITYVFSSPAPSRLRSSVPRSPLAISTPATHPQKRPDRDPFLEEDDSLASLMRTPERGRRTLATARRSLDFQFDAATLAADMTGLGDETMASTEFGDRTMDTVEESMLGGGSPTERLPRMEEEEEEEGRRESGLFDEVGMSSVGEMSDLQLGSFDDGGMEVGEGSMAQVDLMGAFDEQMEPPLVDFGGEEPELMVRSPLKRAQVAEVQTKRKLGVKVGMKKKHPIPEQAVKKLLINTGKVKQPSRDVLDAVLESSERYFKMVANDLKDYAGHAGRKTLNKNDVLLLMNRQRRTIKKKPLAIAARQYLPRELLQEFEG